jgi:hypothetical protein
MKNIKIFYMKKLKKIEFDDSTIHLLNDKSIKIDIYNYSNYSVKIKNDEDFENLKQFYEQNHFTNNLSFNYVYLQVSKKLDFNGYDTLTPQKSYDVLKENYDDIRNNKEKYVKYFITLCQDDIEFKGFIITEKIKNLQIINLYKDVIIEYGSTNILYDFLRQSKDKQELDERKNMIIDHMKKNSVLYYNERNHFSSLYKELTDCFDFLKKRKEKDWKELEDYLLEFVKQDSRSFYTDIYFSYCDIFKKESSFLNSIITNFSANHAVLKYLLNNVSDKNLVDEYLKNKITTPIEAYVYIESIDDIESENDLKKVPSSILNLLASDYSVFFNFFIYHLDRKKIRFYQIEKRILEEKNHLAIWKYIYNLLRGRWKEAEPILKENNEYWEIYNDFIKSKNKEDFEDPFDDFD